MLHGRHGLLSELLLLNQIALAPKHGRLLTGRCHNYVFSELYVGLPGVPRICTVVHAVHASRNAWLTAFSFIIYVPPADTRCNAVYVHVCMLRCILSCVHSRVELHHTLTRVHV